MGSFSLSFHKESFAGLGGPCPEHPCQSGLGMGCSQCSVMGPKVGTKWGFGRNRVSTVGQLSGPLSQFNAILSLRYPLNLDRMPPVVGSGIVRPYFAPRITRLPHLDLLRRLNRAIVAKIVSEFPWNQARNKNAMEVAIVSRLAEGCFCLRVLLARFPT